MIRIIAVSYGGSSDLHAYVGSLISQTYADWELLIVNNLDTGLEDQALRIISELDRRITLLSPKANLGYLGAARYALQQSRPDTEWTIISNTDIVIRDVGALEKVAAAVADDTSSTVVAKAPAILAPAIISGATHVDQNPFMQSRPTRFQTWRRYALLRTPIQVQAAIGVKVILVAWRRLMVSPRETQEQEAIIFAAHGSFFAIHRSFFSGGGNLNYPLHLFGEELFLANQCRLGGLRVVYRPDIQVGHREHAQTGTLRSWNMLRKTSRAAAYAYEHYDESEF